MMTRGHQADYEVLTQVLRSGAKYLGCIGSKRKLALCRERLLRQEIPFGVHDYPIPWVLTEAGLFEDGTPSRLE